MLHFDAIEKTRTALRSDPTAGRKPVSVNGVWNCADGRFHITLPFPKGRTPELLFCPSNESGCMAGPNQTLTIPDVCLWGFSVRPSTQSNHSPLTLSSSHRDVSRGQCNSIWPTKRSPTSFCFAPQKQLMIEI